jgi:uncharacterized membrane protein (DUF2068 family)
VRKNPGYTAKEYGAEAEDGSDGGGLPICRYGNCRGGRLLAAFRNLGAIAGLALLLLGAGTLAAGAGLLQGKRWAWWFAVVLFAIDGAGDVVSLVVTADWLRSAAGMAICSAFLYALSRSRVSYSQRGA